MPGETRLATTGEIPAGGGGLLAQFSRDFATTPGRTRSCLSALLLPK